ncbi:hypothetical protein PROFUN_08861 [Planoprotostelium fungivorum]|uniref:Uncharacterized protein n=1 Tax=Planoprotostelium fungivorum TaxID=1890364 RepID=A0A2P6NJ08_9EUKA|nr:hypothetical protein PROFUN_08861 [Planoprotostelium fungivorum]
MDDPGHHNEWTDKSEIETVLSAGALDHHPLTHMPPADPLPMIETPTTLAALHQQYSNEVFDAEGTESHFESNFSSSYSVTQVPSPPDINISDIHLKRTKTPNDRKRSSPKTSGESDSKKRGRPNVPISEHSNPSVKYKRISETVDKLTSEPSFLKKMINSDWGRKEYYETHALWHSKIIQNVAVSLKGLPNNSPLRKQIIHLIGEDVPVQILAKLLDVSEKTIYRSRKIDPIKGIPQRNNTNNHNHSSHEESVHHQISRNPHHEDLLEEQNVSIAHHGVNSAHEDHEVQGVEETEDIQGEQSSVDGIADEGDDMQPGMNGMNTYFTLPASPFEQSREAMGYNDKAEEE